MSLQETIAESAANLEFPACSQFAVELPEFICPRQFHPSMGFFRWHLPAELGQSERPGRGSFTRRGWATRHRARSGGEWPVQSFIAFVESAADQIANHRDEFIQILSLCRHFRIVAYCYQHILVLLDFEDELVFHSRNIASTPAVPQRSLLKWALDEPAPWSSRFRGARTQTASCALPEKTPASGMDRVTTNQHKYGKGICLLRLVSMSAHSWLKNLTCILARMYTLPLYHFHDRSVWILPRKLRGWHYTN